LRLAVALAFAGSAACGDSRPGTEPSSQPTTPPRHTLAGLRGTADLVAGTLTFEPLPTASPAQERRESLIRPGIYGDQGVTVRIYNSPVTIANPSSPGKKTFSAPVGVRNLLGFPIGDEQAGATPTDTMGVYVFVSDGPTVTSTSSSCSPACSVTVLNEHGTLTFTAANQPYWHWNERLGAAGGGNDTTRVRRTWTFEADTQVTAFQFEVLVSAAWANPNDSQWKIAYEGDSVPDVNVEPRWRREAAGAAGTIALNSPSAGIVTIGVPAAARLAFLQNDSLGSTMDAYIEARFRTNTVTIAPEVSFGMDDDTRFIGVGLTTTQVGFLAGNFLFSAPSVSTTGTTFHTYRIRKFGSDSVQLLRDGTRIASRLYSALPISLSGLPTLTYFFYFGGPGRNFPPTSATGNSSSWDYVIYEIGVTEP
jgi:hypothetical protein